MARPSELVKLSKQLSYLLRHHPEAAGLELDETGYTTIRLGELARRLGVSAERIRQVVRTDPKERFGIRRGSIRANFGHSIALGRAMYEGRPPASAADLPAVLYHGTSPQSVASIERDGLRPRGRQFVHLSTSREWAQRVGGRHRARPEILEVDAADALRRGVRMWRAGPATVLSTRVPPQCLRRTEG